MPPPRHTVCNSTISSFHWLVPRRVRVSPRRPERLDRPSTTDERPVLFRSRLQRIHETSERAAQKLMHGRNTVLKRFLHTLGKVQPYKPRKGGHRRTLWLYTASVNVWLRLVAHRYCMCNLQANPPLKFLRSLARLRVGLKVSLTGFTPQLRVYFSVIFALSWHIIASGDQKIYGEDQVGLSVYSRCSLSIRESKRDKERSMCRAPPILPPNSPLHGLHSMVGYFLTVQDGARVPAGGGAV